MNTSANTSVNKEGATAGPENIHSDKVHKLQHPLYESERVIKKVIALIMIFKKINPQIKILVRKML